MTFYATVTVEGGGEPQEIDARPSDALNLAVRTGAPVYVAAEVIDRPASGRNQSHWGAPTSKTESESPGQRTTRRPSSGFRPSGDPCRRS